MIQKVCHYETLSIFTDGGFWTIIPAEVYPSLSRSIDLSTDPGLKLH
jgi:hypothetical protein